jgi:hypothetical protein
MDGQTNDRTSGDTLHFTQRSLNGTSLPNVSWTSLGHLLSIRAVDFQLCVRFQLGTSLFCVWRLSGLICSLIKVNELFSEWFARAALMEKLID